MTLGNMRANGVHTLAVWCLGRYCNHFQILREQLFRRHIGVLFWSALALRTLRSPGCRCAAELE